MVEWIATFTPEGVENALQPGEANSPAIECLKISLHWPELDRVGLARAQWVSVSKKHGIPGIDGTAPRAGLLLGIVSLFLRSSDGHFPDHCLKGRGVGPLYAHELHAALLKNLRRGLTGSQDLGSSEPSSS